MDGLLNFLNTSYTSYQAVENAEAFLTANGFIKLKEADKWQLETGKGYYVTRGGSSVIAFRVGNLDRLYFKLVCSHTDSPALKLKENPACADNLYLRLNAETYGGGLWYTFFDRPLKIAGRVVYEGEDGLKSENVVSPFNVTVPSLAVHMNRGVNDGFAVNPQIDLIPLAGKKGGNIFQSLTDKTVLSHDLYVVPADEPFFSGVDNEFLCSPRLDNLTSVYSSLEALAVANGAGVDVACCFDNEEVGSGTLQGAGSDFLYNTLTRIAAALGYDAEETKRAFAASFSISLDNAHALHPNHPEKCDPTNRPALGGGVVIKSHANKAYCTDALSSALVKALFQKSGVKYQTFCNRSDMRSGSTLGAISLKQVSVLTADLGLAQLAMHSAVECFAAEDYDNLVKGLSAFYGADFAVGEDGVCLKTEGDR